MHLMSDAGQSHLGNVNYFYLLDRLFCLKALPTKSLEAPPKYEQSTAKVPDKCWGCAN